MIFLYSFIYVFIFCFINFRFVCVQLFFATSFPAIQNTTNVTISTATIVEPTGVAHRIASKIPISEVVVEITAAAIVTEMKFRKTRIADNDGKIINAEIKSEPTKFIAKTMIMAIITAMKRLYFPAFIPVAVANSSSNVTAKILL